MGYNAAEALLMVYHTTNPIEPHAVHRERLMRHAWRELARGDRAQASEKMWGAFAHGLKVVANECHWEYQNHAQVNHLVMALIRESGELELQKEARTAQTLHMNYYCDELQPAQIELDLREVERGLGRLHRISQRYRDDADYRARADELLPPYSRYNFRERRWEPLSVNGSPADQ